MAQLVHQKRRHSLGLSVTKIGNKALGFLYDDVVIAWDFKGEGIIIAYVDDVYAQNYPGILKYLTSKSTEVVLMPEADLQQKAIELMRQVEATDIPILTALNPKMLEAEANSIGCSKEAVVEI